MSKSKEAQIKYACDELFEKGNLEIVETDFSPDYIAHFGEKEFHGHSCIKRFVVQLRTAIQNINIVEVKFLAKDVNTIIWQRTLKGTHETKMQGISPSGKKVQWIEMIVTRFKNGKITEEWIASELMGELLLKATKV